MPLTPSAHGIAMSDDPERLQEALPSYEIGEVLGRGGWGVVFGGLHRHLGRKVAIKQLPAAFAADPAARRRFASEARVLAALDHPHVVPVYDYLERDDLCLLVMEQLPGGTLREHASEEGFTARTAVAVALACAAGLSAAHHRGVLHRDIKPENMLYTASGVVKVTDFGIAKVSGGAETALTRAGDILGTAAYIAPEQVRGGALSPATDVYGLATMLYELLAGDLPFPDDGNVLSVMFKHAYEVPAALRAVAPDIPEPVATVVMTGLATDPADRATSAETFAVALAEAGAAAWGPRWLTLENVPVLGAPTLLAAAGREPDRPRPPPAPEPVSSSTSTAHETGPLPPFAEESDRLGGSAAGPGVGPTTINPVSGPGGSVAPDRGSTKHDSGEPPQSGRWPLRPDYKATPGPVRYPSALPFLGHQHVVGAGASPTTINPDPVPGPGGSVAPDRGSTEHDWAEPPQPGRWPLRPDYQPSPGPLRYPSPLPFLAHQHVVDDLRARLRFAPGGSLLVTGTVGVGKTTVVARALDELHTELVSTTPEPTPVVVVWESVARPTSPEELLGRLVRGLAEALERAGIVARLPPEVAELLDTAHRRTFAPYTLADLEHDVVALLAALAAGAGSETTSSRKWFRRGGA
ncbi:MAG: hypothetical protein QOE59_4014, partial [Actinomycetota bacterium]|nr:hypothetical protein [Actinomycetota bacterium]